MGVKAFGAPAALEVETAYEGLRAVGMRHRIADQGLRALQRDCVRSAATARARATAQATEGGGVSWILLLLLVGAVGLTIAFTNGALDDVPGLLARLRQGRRRRAFAASFEGRPGDSPALPLPLAHAGDLPRQLARLRCACGGALDPTPREPSEMTFGGRPVRSAVFSCGTCPQGRRIYFSG
jgi:hypothetical protein